MKVFTKLIVLVLLFAVNASAFSPGPTIIRECPKCKAPIEQPTMASGNTFGARYWSDGKMDAPMLPDYPWLVKCPKCKNLLWIDEAKKLGDTRKGWKGQGKIKPQSPVTPTESDFHKVAARVKDKRKQNYVRNRLWHYANDPYRDKAPSGTVIFSARAKANMNALSKLLNVKNPEERLVKAEIARELGQFDQCLRLLNIRFDKRLSDTAKAIKMLAQARYAPVMEFSKPNNYQMQANKVRTTPTNIESLLFIRAMKESCVNVANGLLTRYGFDALMSYDPAKLREAIKTGAAKGDGSAVAEALDTVAAEGSVEAVKFLLDSGARINGRSDFSEVTPLITACRNGKERIVKLLIDRGANVNEGTEFGQTPLSIACDNRSRNLMALLLDNGAKIDGGDKYNSPLMALCIFRWYRPDDVSNIDWAKKTFEMIKILIDRGANVNGAEGESSPLVEICAIKFDKNQFSPITYTEEEKAACMLVYQDIARLLLDKNADVNKCDSFGCSPLLSACEAGNLGMVKLLIERGADVNKPSNEGETPLSVASQLPDKSIEKLLLEHGAKPKAKK